MTDDETREARAVAAVRAALRQHEPFYIEATHSCGHCNWTWPCPTVAVIRAALAEEAS